MQHGQLGAFVVLLVRLIWLQSLAALVTEDTISDVKQRLLQTRHFIYRMSA
jgi:hypothetical protein